MPLHRRSRVAAFIAAVGLLVVSCDKLPTQPTTSTESTLLTAPSGSFPRSSGPLAFVSDRDGANAIYLANADGSAATRITAGDWPDWSRDGGRLAFTHQNAIFVINVDGSGLSRLAVGFGPITWSPDGAKIAFSRNNGEIVTINPDGSGASVLVSRDLVWGSADDYDNFTAISPAWSPDGRTIAFVRASFYYISVNEIYLISVDGSALRPLIPTSGARFAQNKPAWSPDGTAIAFNGIGVAYSDGSGWKLGMPTLFSAFNPGSGSNPDWTPDSRLIFDRPTSPDRRGRVRIFVGDSGAGEQLIPEATAPTLADYSDRHAVWLR